MPLLKYRTEPLFPNIILYSSVISPFLQCQSLAIIDLFSVSKVVLSPAYHINGIIQSVASLLSIMYLRYIHVILLVIFSLLLNESENFSVVSDSLWPHGLYSPWNSPGQKTGVGSLSLLQGIFLTQGFNQCIVHCRRILYQLSYQGSGKENSMDLWFMGSLRGEHD